jgi:nucleoside-diphosphate-sugar epimerase
MLALHRRATDRAGERESGSTLRIRGVGLIPAAAAINLRAESDLLRVAIKVGRIFNTYGPRMHPNDGRVISNFIVQALLSRDITVFGDGSQTRSFCYVDDLIEALIRFMNTPADVTGPMNLGNPQEFTILELASLVIKLTDHGLR